MRVGRVASSVVVSLPHHAVWTGRTPLDPPGRGKQNKSLSYESAGIWLKKDGLYSWTRLAMIEEGEGSREFERG